MMRVFHHDKVMMERTFLFTLPERILVEHLQIRAISNVRDFRSNMVRERVQGE
jgi:hypothetical protein